ncbi:glycosyltransferase [Micromonospora sp. NPDC048999]|uniref:glycosyltransferase n=1 Tax=Micromonospora sp. NPDC048999 TaxID=3155391 RepID=UPI0033FC7C5A
MDRPVVSVIIPTYNGSALLRRTLHHLSLQRLPTDRFEVIVADDGSSDDTRAVVDEAAARLRIRYHFQPDEGFRAGAARNAGALLADAPLLVFLDTGAMVGPDFLTAHLSEHVPGGRSAVMGYAHGYNLQTRVAGLAEALARADPEDVVREFGAVPEFADVRHEQFADCDFDAGRLAAPWVLFWTLNCSLPAEDFWRAGGFDEGFRGWGLEDQELGHRLFHGGMAFRVSRRAWVVESPHERDLGTIFAECRANLVRLMAKHPEPAVEILWHLMEAQENPLGLEAHYSFLRGWTEQARELAVTAEIEQALAEVPPDARVAIFGCGAKVPPRAATTVLIDFDATVRPQHHAIGLRTPLADHAVDAVLLTSRLSGLWARWGRDLTAEARRVGGTVHRTADLAGQTSSS